MNDKEILSKISYLDPGLDEKPTPSFLPGHNQLMELMREVIQIEMAKQGRLQTVDDVSDRLASLEKRMTAMRREFMRQRGTPSVVYVPSSNTPIATVSPSKAKLPTVMIAFYILGLVCSLGFAALLALSAMKVDTIHPFISLLGLVGGLGWLTTAWTDLLLWKRENPSAANTITQKERALKASNAR